MKKILFLPLILCLANAVLSQNRISAVDSLTRVLKTEKEDSAKVETLILLSKNLLQVSDYGKVLTYANEALFLAEKIKFKKGISEAHNKIGSAYFRQGKYPEALKNQLISLEIEEEIGNKHGISTEYNSIGNIYADQLNFSEALKNYSASLKIAEEMGYKKEIAVGYTNIGNLYGIQQHYPEALKDFEKALKIEEEIADKPGIAVCYNNIGNVYLLQGNYDGALKNHLNSLKISQQMGDKQAITASYINLGALYLKFKKPVKAKEYDTDALLLAKEIGSKDEIVNCYTNLAQLDSSLGAFKESCKYLLLRSEMKDSIFNEKSSKQLSQLSIQYETDKKEKELATLTIENELQIRKTKERDMYILLSSSLLLLVISVVWFQSYKRQKKIIISNKEIEKKELELKNKDLSIEKEKAEERIRVQREIAGQYHDILGSKITSLVFMCENKKTEREKQNSMPDEFAFKVSMKLKEIGEANRSGIMALDTNLEWLDSFIAKLRSGLDDMVETAGKEINFLVPLNIPRIRIEPIVKFNLIALIKEAISNSIKYSKTNDVTVQVEITGTRYVIKIMDKGAGIDTEKIKGHSYGLQNMKHHMENIGGTCEIISGINEGTTIRLDGDFKFSGLKNYVEESNGNGNNHFPGIALID